MVGTPATFGEGWGSFGSFFCSGSFCFVLSFGWLTHHARLVRYSNDFSWKCHDQGGDVRFRFRSVPLGSVRLVAHVHSLNSFVRSGFTPSRPAARTSWKGSSSAPYPASPSSTRTSAGVCLHLHLEAALVSRSSFLWANKSPCLYLLPRGEAVPYFASATSTTGLIGFADSSVRKRRNGRCSITGAGWTWRRSGKHGHERSCRALREFSHPRAKTTPITPVRFLCSTAVQFARPSPFRPGGRLLPAAHRGRGSTWRGWRPHGHASRQNLAKRPPHRSTAAPAWRGGDQASSGALPWRPSSTGLLHTGVLPIAGLAGRH